MKAHFIFNRFMLVAALLASLFGSALQTFPVHAAGIVVNTNADTTANDGKCTLREAIIAANTDVPSGPVPGECSAGSGADTISFAGNYVITVGSQLPSVSTAMAIAGTGTQGTIIQAAANPNVATWRVLQVTDIGNLTLDQVTVRNGRCNGSCTDPIFVWEQAGGGIHNNGTLTVTNSSFTGNNSGFGGAIYNHGTMTVTNTSFSGNSAGNGGGIGNNWPGSATVSKATISSNTAESGGGLSNYGTLWLSNSTIASNAATKDGGGFYSSGTAQTVVNSTISMNSINPLAGNGAAIWNNASNPPTLKNTIVANSILGVNCFGGVVNGGNNLEDGTSCGWGSNNGSKSNTDPKLDVLGNNGGPTQTMKLLAGSPAIDAGNDSVCIASPVSGVDQRDVARPQGSQCDIGAYEVTTPKTISGNAGTAGVTLSYNDGTPKTVTSQADGSYSLSVPYGWSGTVTPSHLCYTFTPPNKIYNSVIVNQTSQDYTAILNTAVCGPKTISGNVGAPGVTTLSYTDGTPKTVITYGNYSITVPYGWSGTVTPSNPCYTFSPLKKSYNNPVTTNKTSENYSATFNNAPVCNVTVGVFRPSNGVIFLKNSNTSGFADMGLNYGLAGDYPVAGDWDGDGDDTIGVYRNGTFLLRNSNTPGFADLSIPLIPPGNASNYQPVVGDWNNDGKDTIGVYNRITATFFLRNSNTVGSYDISFPLGNPGDVAIAGDWNGDGKDTVGVFRPSNGVIFLKNSNSSGFADVALNYGTAGDKPVVGDWDGDGDDTIGVYRGNKFLLRNSNTVGFANITIDLGIPGDMPIAGNWDGKP